MRFSGMGITKYSQIAVMPSTESGEVSRGRRKKGEKEGEGEEVGKKGRGERTRGPYMSLWMSSISFQGSSEAPTG
jgi:hypothetical protein